MKIAITGGAGFIGTHLTRAYLDVGHDVLVIDRLLHGSRQAVDQRALLSPGYSRWETAHHPAAGMA